MANSKGCYLLLGCHPRKLLTADNLLKRGWVAYKYSCPLSTLKPESITHLLLQCPYSSSMRYNLLGHTHINAPMPNQDSSTLDRQEIWQNSRASSCWMGLTCTIYYLAFSEKCDMVISLSSLQEMQMK